jgi:PPOX class probable F420-dependent enzyme
VASLHDARRLIGLDNALASVSTIRPDGSIQTTVVNAGIVDHPVHGSEVAAFVARGGTRKIVHLRARPTAALLWRAGWAWVAIEGTTELCGPDDPLAGIGDEGQTALLRRIAVAAGVDHDDWDEFDRMVAAEGRTAVLLTPRRIYQNP